MKKLVSFVLVFAEMLSVVACGAAEDDGGLRFNGGDITQREDEITEQSKTAESETAETTAVTEAITTEHAASVPETESIIQKFYAI